MHRLSALYTYVAVQRYIFSLLHFSHQYLYRLAQAESPISVSDGGELYDSQNEWNTVTVYDSSDYSVPKHEIVEFSEWGDKIYTFDTSGETKFRLVKISLKIESNKIPYI